MGTYNRTVTIDVTPTITAGAYSANDVIGGLQTVYIGVGKGGTIRRVNIADDDSEEAAMTLYIFDQLPSTIADNAAFAPTFADLQKLVDTVAVGTYVTVNSNDYSINKDLNIDYDTDNTGGTDSTFYVYAVVTGTPTFTGTTDLTFRYTVWID
eukprot:GHVR01183488.1.p1 GENE.GHVR01183488.1~~GHVR01183488.1.p1  ORF type:complete len:153 (+),score=8.17 GHVR01183488.1:403-861(+)